MARPKKPVHTIQQVKSISRSRYSAERAILTYWNTGRLTEIFFRDILKIESECEELIITIKSDRIRSYFTRKGRFAAAGATTEV